MNISKRIETLPKTSKIQRWLMSNVINDICSASKLTQNLWLLEHYLSPRSKSSKHFALKNERQVHNILFTKKLWGSIGCHRGKIRRSHCHVYKADQRTIVYFRELALIVINCCLFGHHRTLWLCYRWSCIRSRLL